jgi:hypothetical protein
LSSNILNCRCRPMIPLPPRSANPFLNL